MGHPSLQKSKSTIPKFQPCKKAQKGALINAKTIATANFPETKNVKVAKPPFYENKEVLSKSGLLNRIRIPRLA